MTRNSEFLQKVVKCNPVMKLYPIEDKLVEKTTLLG